MRVWFFFVVIFEREPVDIEALQQVDCRVVVPTPRNFNAPIPHGITEVIVIHLAQSFGVDIARLAAVSRAAPILALADWGRDVGR
jgi:hypothetical protein